MANLNLSQFGEKLFVTDADHTFIWDTAASISKRVSRNSWLNSGTLTSDAPVTISQTWNAVGQTFKALVVNAAGTSGTNSASGSLLLDLQVGGVSQASFNKDGRLLIVTQGAASTPSILIGTGAGFYQPTNTQISFSSNTLEAIRFTNAGIRLGLNELGFGSAFNVSPDTILLRDGAPNTLALRNGGAAQTFRVYGAYPDTGINYARLALSCDTSGNATISTQALGTYTAGTVSINGVPVGLGKGSSIYNVAIGTDSLFARTTGVGNLGIGYVALSKTTTGNYNIGIGFESGTVSTTGSNNIFIGGLTASASGGTAHNNQIVIGHHATGIGSNSVVLGNDSIEKTALKGNVGIGTTSPSSKLQVTNGDVEIETVTSGIIMKAAGTSTRYRITLNAGGTALVFTAI